MALRGQNFATNGHSPKSHPKSTRFHPSFPSFPFPFSLPPIPPILYPYSLLFLLSHIRYKILSVHVRILRYFVSSYSSMIYSFLELLSISYANLSVTSTQNYFYKLTLILRHARSYYAHAHNVRRIQPRACQGIILGF